MMAAAAKMIGEVLAPQRARAGSTGYDAATSGRRLAGFFGSNESISSLLLGAGLDLRGKSHKLVRENAYAGAAVDEWASQAIGTGIRPQSRYIAPGEDTAAVRIASRSMRRQIHTVWNDSVDEFDAAGLTDGYGLMMLGWRTMVEAGECFVRILPRRLADGLAVPIQYQVIEPDHVPMWMNQRLENGNSIRCGIEFDPQGRKVAYWVHPEHPLSGALFLSGDNMPVRVPASQMMHVFAPIRPGQLRGEPWLSKVLIKIFNLDQWDDATLERQKLGAMLLAWIEENQTPGIDPMLLTKKVAGPDGVNDLQDGASGEMAPDGIEFGNLQPGTVLRMLRNEVLKFFEAPANIQNYGEFTEAQLRAVAQGIKSLPYENMTGDNSKSNFSSHRARKLMFERICEQLQFLVLVPQMLRPTWRSWMDAAVLSGALVMPGYDLRPRPYQRVAWRTQAWPWMDPLNEVKAEVIAIDNLLKPRSATIQERYGYDEDDCDEGILADQEREDDLGLRRRGPNVQDTIPVEVTKGANQ